MKTRVLICVLIAGAFLFSGCVAQEIEETLYLGDANVKAPIVTPPVHLNIKSNPGEITFSPKFSITNSRNMQATSDEVYTGVVTLPDSSVYKTRNKNIEWIYSKYSFGVDMDLKVSRGFAFFGGISFSDENFMGGNFGIGLFSDMKDPIFRFDVGLSFQKYKYDAVTVVEQTITDWQGNQTRNRFLFHDTGEETNFNPFFTITLNSNNDSAFANYFVNAGYFIQQLLNYSPGTSYYQDPLFVTSTVSTDKRPDCSAGFFYLNPGVALSLAPNIRVLIGVKILKETILQMDSGSLLILPNLQMDFRL